MIACKKLQILVGRQPCANLRWFHIRNLALVSVFTPQEIV